MTRRSKPEPDETSTTDPSVAEAMLALTRAESRLAKFQEDNQAVLERQAALQAKVTEAEAALKIAVRDVGLPDQPDGVEGEKSIKKQNYAGPGFTVIISQGSRKIDAGILLAHHPELASHHDLWSISAAKYDKALEGRNISPKAHRAAVTYGEPTVMIKRQSPESE